jgi:hypothetical protein
MMSLTMDRDDTDRGLPGEYSAVSTYLGRSQRDDLPSHTIFRTHGGERFTRFRRRDLHLATLLASSATVTAIKP